MHMQNDWGNGDGRRKEFLFLNPTSNIFLGAIALGYSWVTTHFTREAGVRINESNEEGCTSTLLVSSLRYLNQKNSLCPPPHQMPPSSPGQDNNTVRVFLQRSVVERKRKRKRKRKQIVSTYAQGLFVILFYGDTKYIHSYSAEQKY